MIIRIGVDGACADNLLSRSSWIESYRSVGAYTTFIAFGKFGFNTFRFALFVLVVDRWHAVVVATCAMCCGFWSVNSRGTASCQVRLGGCCIIIKWWPRYGLLRWSVRHCAECLVWALFAMTDHVFVFVSYTARGRDDWGLTNAISAWLDIRPPQQ